MPWFGPPGYEIGGQFVMLFILCPTSPQVGWSTARDYYTFLWSPYPESYVEGSTVHRTVVFQGKHLVLWCVGGIFIYQSVTEMKNAKKSGFAALCKS